MKAVMVGVVLVVSVSALVSAAVLLPETVAVDTRPPANTIECRDAQIDAYRALPVVVYGDLGTEYEQDNVAVAEILDTARRLRVLCR